MVTNDIFLNNNPSLLMSFKTVKHNDIDQKHLCKFKAIISEITKRSLIFSPQTSYVKEKWIFIL